MIALAPRRDGTCFYEGEHRPSLLRRTVVEGVGSFCLVFVVVGSAALWRFAGDMSALGRAAAVAPTLTALILLFGAASGGHFNPLITLAQTLIGARSWGCLLGYVSSQVVGAIAGAQLSAWLFGRALASGAAPSLVSLGGAELFATTGLLVLVLLAPRMRPAGAAPFAVGGWITMTIVGLAGGPAANPIITLALTSLEADAPPAAMFVHLIGQLGGVVIAPAVALLAVADRVSLAGEHPDAH